MVVQFRSLHGKNHEAMRVPREQIACVRTGDCSSAQGVLVWEHSGLACIQVFSRQVIGERI